MCVLKKNKFISYLKANNLCTHKLVIYISQDKIKLCFKRGRNDLIINLVAANFLAVTKRIKKRDPKLVLGNGLKWQVLEQALDKARAATC